MSHKCTDKQLEALKLVRVEFGSRYSYRVVAIYVVLKNQSRHERIHGPREGYGQLGRAVSRAAKMARAAGWEQSVFPMYAHGAYVGMSNRR